MNDVDTIEAYDAQGKRKTVHLHRNQRAAHITGDLYVIRKDSMMHIAHFLDNLAMECLHTTDEEAA